MLDEQVDRPLGGRSGQGRVHTALEALRRLGDEPVPARRPGDGGRVEVGRLDQYVGRRRVHLGGLPAHDPRDGERHVAAVGDEQVLGVQGAHDVVEGRQCLPRPGASDLDGAAQPGDVEGVQRLPQLEHDVVRHVDGERDRPHPHLGQAPLHPGGRRRGRVDAAHDPRDVAVTARAAPERGVVGQPHGIPAVVGPGRADRRRVTEAALGRALGMPVLPGEAAQGEAVTAVGCDVDLDDLVTEAEERDGVVAGIEPCGGVGAEVVREDDDAGVVLAEAELVLGADHPVGHPAVGLARRDGEVAREDGSGQDDHDEVADREVRCPADDLLGNPLGEALSVEPDVDGAVADRLAVLLHLLVEREHPAHDERAGDVTAVQVLLLETDGHERRRDVATGGARREVDVLLEPSQRCPHVRPPSRTAARSGRRPRRCPSCP